MTTLSTAFTTVLPALATGLATAGGPTAPLPGPAEGLARAVLLANGAVLLLAAALVLVRAVRGPSLLDRVVASDLLVALLISAAAVHACLTGDTSTLPLLLTLSLVAFIGAVAVSRFVARDRDDHDERYGEDTAALGGGPGLGDRDTMRTAGTATGLTTPEEAR